MLHNVLLLGMEIKSVSARDIRLHGIPDELPVYVTRYNKAVAKIVPVESDTQSVTKQEGVAENGSGERDVDTSVTKSVTQEGIGGLKADADKVIDELEEESVTQFSLGTCVACKKRKEVREAEIELADGTVRQVLICEKCYDKSEYDINWVFDS